MFTHITPGKRGTNDSLLIIDSGLNLSFTKKQKQQDQHTQLQQRSPIPLSIRHVVSSFERVFCYFFCEFFFFFLFFIGFSQ
jgi:hypothetical protein